MGIFYEVMAGASLEQNSLFNSILGWFGGIAAGCIALFMLVKIIKHALEYIRGAGKVSVWKFIGEILIFILMLGIVGMALNYDILGVIGKSAGDKSIEILDDQINNAIK